METQRLTGRDAGGLKYDLLTALSVAGLNGAPVVQTSLMRLIALVTARYNWRADELSVGQRDMALMWGVNERTVKREIKRLTEAGILICKRAGVRGRVGAYRLGYARIAEMSEPYWSSVGPDFVTRMGERYRQATPVKVVQLRAYQPGTEPIPVADVGAGTWGAVLKVLAAEQPDLTGAWFARLSCLGLGQGVLRLSAPSAFVQRYVETHHMPLLLRAVEQVMGPVEQVVFER